MAGAPARPYTEALETLWGAGTCAGLSDGDLLARFLTGRDPAGELAFEVLVKRHGPMVERVCHQVLDDPGDIHDAWQATFLVLARKAQAIRKRESIAGWLHGVALRVARRRRATTIRRLIRDRRTNEAARALETEQPRAVEPSGVDRDERAEIVHHEIGRLPEKYRAPIVLCYMEGLTHDEAAACLKWPVGTVRSRLSRGRDTLRHRLTRRGVRAPAAIGPLGAWLSGGDGVTPGAATAIPAGATRLVAKMASEAVAGPLSAAKQVEATSLALAQGVLQMMTIKKVIFVGGVLLSVVAVSSAGGLALVHTSRARAEQTKPSQVEQQKPQQPKDAAASINLGADRFFQEMLEIARLQFEAVRQRYTGGEIGPDPLIDANDKIENLELRAATDQAARLAARQRSLKRLKGIEEFVDSMAKRGQATHSNVAAIKLRRMEEEFDMKSDVQEQTDIPAILDRLKALEKKVEALEKRFSPPAGGLQ
jgi:RNA polymerase sigma factor (sigma-70 family)